MVLNTVTDKDVVLWKMNAAITCLRDVSNDCDEEEIDFEATHKLLSDIIGGLVEVEAFIKRKVE